ncbi:tautomerase family protein [Azospirillum sp. sgz302134]
MPFIRITLRDADLTPDTRHALALGATDLIATTLGKRREVTAVLVERPDGCWTIGGAAVEAAAQLEAFITAGTNTPSEKAAFVEGAMALLKRHLPGLPEATYVVVREVAAGDWGYDGRTQAARAAA